jgi:hypothetical protein
METWFAFYNPFPNEKRSAVSKQGMADSFILGAAIST